MPITPYTQPIQFEYKPLNLAAFAVPLAQMQEKFDVTQALINESDVDLAHLNFGTDAVKAEALKGTYREKRDELVKNLSETGNYTQAATKLKELNRLWQNDPERKAIEYNYTARQNYMKEQKERMDKGEITRDQYYQDVARKDRDYTTGQGTYWQHDPNLEEGKYNLYGTKGRLKDLEKDLEEMSWKVANAVEGDKRAGALMEIGIDPELMDKKFMQTIIEERDANKVASAVSGYLKTLPRFRDWALEKADYNYDELKATNPEKYKEKTKELTNNALESIDSQISRITAKAKKEGKKDLLETEEFKDLLAYKAELEKGKASGEFDEPLIKGLYNQEALNKMYDMSALGKVFEYKKIDRDYSWRDLELPKDGGKGGDGDLEDPLNTPGGFTPTTYDPLNMNNLTTQRVTNAKALLPNISNMVNIASGNMRTLTQGWKGSQYRENMQKNPGLQREKLNKIYTIAANTMAKGGDATDFQRALWNAGIKEGNNAKTAGAVFRELSGNKGNTLNYMREQLEQSEGAFQNWQDAKEQEVAIDKNLISNNEYRKYLGEFEQSNNVVVDKNTLEKLKKLGLDPPTDYVKIRDKNGNITYSYSVPINTYLKSLKDSNGNTISSLEEAVKKGINLNNIKLAPSQYPGGGGYDINDLTSINKGLQDKKQELINKGTSGEFMSFRYVGDKKVDKFLNAQFLTASDLSAFHPSTKPNFKGVPGFDEDGRMLQGTQLMLTDKQAVKIVRKGNRMLLEVPYQFINEDGKKAETSVLVDFKKGQDPLKQKLINHITYLTADTKDTDNYSNQTYKTAKSMQYDVLAKSDLTQNNFDLVDVGPKDKPVVLETLPTGATGTNVEIVKEYVKGRPPILSVRVNNGEKTEYLTRNGKKFSTTDVNEAKVFVAENLWGE